MIYIDDTPYDVKCSVQRTANLRPSDVSGLMLDRNYFNDVLGTYMAYDVTLKYPLKNRDRYDGLYETLIEPVDGHAFNLPYNQGRLVISARIESVTDERVELDSRREYWASLSFTITANHPSKALTLEQMITRGRAPVPEITQPDEGDTYTWYYGRWSKTAYYENADIKRY